MALTVTYDGNGNTGGTPPVDNNSYNANDLVTVLEPFLPRDGISTAPAHTVKGTLERAGAEFAYWATQRDGGGMWFYWPQGGSTFRITSDITIFAQWYIKAGLHNAGLSKSGPNPRYTFAYDSVLQRTTANPTGLEPNRTNQVLDASEGDYDIMSNWFGGLYTLPSSLPIYIANRTGGAATNTGVVVLTQGAGSSELLRASIVSEVTEIFMSLQNKGWGHVLNKGNEESAGEGLSLFLTQQFALIQGFANPFTDFAANTGNNWLNTSLPTTDPNSTRIFGDQAGYDYGSRADYVNTIAPWHGNGPATGCSILFLYYLHTQLGFTIPQIIAAAPGFTNGKLNATATLRGVYQNLTGHAGDPFPFFKQLLDTAFPSNAVSAVPGSNPDDPFPLAQLSFWVDKSTFGKDEVQDVIDTGGGKWPKAFWLVIEGLSATSFNSLRITIPAFSGTFAALPGITITRNPNIDFENAASPQTPQRIRIPYDITFTQAALASFPANDSVTYALSANLDYIDQDGTTQRVPISDASTRFELVAGADPYFTNIDPAQNNVFYLSQDLRVFSTPADPNRLPVQGGPEFKDDSTAGAFAYIQKLLAWLNDPGNGFTDGTNDPFVSSLFPGQAAAFNGDSSVVPVAIDVARPFPHLARCYNFAIARVRLRGTTKASNVRVFFRLWSTESPDTDFAPSSTYRSTPDSAGLPGVPLVGSDHVTLPFFATAGETDYADGTNIRDIQAAAGGDVAWAYFGCFLNVYDSTNVVDGQPVQAWLNGTHHCIVAQIAFDGAPVLDGANPEASDKLAQRNLQVTHSDNPGPAETHRIPQTFDIRPSTVVGTNLGQDELMIDWGNIPPGSLAAIYWPQVLASDVLALASKLYSSQALVAADTNTIQCKITGGVTYIPIPVGTGDNFAGLLTVDLPPTVITGQEFNIVVRRIARRQWRSAAVVASARSWRYVVGTFQVKIPVTTGDAMLWNEANTLAIMKWRLQQMLSSNRWYPVLQRYVSYIAGRVRGLGGDPDAIAPSLAGTPGTGSGRDKVVGYTGKVCEVRYDCFGEFDGFVLESCDGHQRFETCERGINEIVLRACRERMTITVYVGANNERKIRQIVVRCCRPESPCR